MTGDVRFEGRSSISYLGIILAADRIAGNTNTELVFSGNAVISVNGATTYADTIHFFPRTRRYRLDNARTILTPEMLQGTAPTTTYMSRPATCWERAPGTRWAKNTTETTCIEPFHHYELRSRDAQIFPGKRLVLHQTSVYLFGAKLITLPYLVIPLDQKPRKARPDGLSAGVRPELRRGILRPLSVRVSHRRGRGQLRAGQRDAEKGRAHTPGE